MANSASGWSATPSLRARLIATPTSLGTQDPKLLYHAGMIEIAVGRTSAGEAHLRAALALNPAFDPLGAAAVRAALAD